MLNKQLFKDRFLLVFHKFYFHLSQLFIGAIIKLYKISVLRRVLLFYSTWTIQPSGASISPNWIPVNSSYNLRVTGPTSVSLWKTCSLSPI